MYGTVRSLAPSRATPIAGLEDVLYAPPYFYHIPPPPPLNTYPGRKRRKREKVSFLFYFVAMIGNVVNGWTDLTKVTKVNLIRDQQNMQSIFF